MPLKTWSAAEILTHSDLNDNFALCVLTDTARTISAAHTWSAGQTWNAAQQFHAGTVAAPGVAVGEAASGLYRIGAANLGLSINGTKKIDYAAGNMTLSFDLLFTDATYDIGKSGATRPRDGFFSRNMTIGGTLTLTGAATFSATINARSAIRFSDEATYGATWDSPGSAIVRLNLDASQRWIVSNNGTERMGLDSSGTFYKGTNGSREAEIYPASAVTVDGSTNLAITRRAAGVNSNQSVNWKAFSSLAAGDKVLVLAG